MPPVADAVRVMGVSADCGEASDVERETAVTGLMTVTDTVFEVVARLSVSVATAVRAYVPADTLLQVYVYGLFVTVPSDVLPW